MCYGNSKQGCFSLFYPASGLPNIFDASFLHNFCTCLLFQSYFSWFPLIVLFQEYIIWIQICLLLFQDQGGAVLGSMPVHEHNTCSSTSLFIPALAGKIVLVSVLGKVQNLFTELFHLYSNVVFQASYTGQNHICAALHFIEHLYVPVIITKKLLPVHMLKIRLLYPLSNAV